MKVSGLHGFDLSPSEARRLQEELASRVVAGPALDLAGREARGRGRRVYAGRHGLRHGRGARFPRALARRGTGVRGAAPVSLRARAACRSGSCLLSLVPWRRSRRKWTRVILDAQGLAHPRRMGLASHLGIFLDVPTVGCAKSLLVGSFEEPGREKGSATDLVHRGEVVGQGPQDAGMGSLPSTSRWATA